MKNNKIKFIFLASIIGTFIFFSSCNFFPQKEKIVSSFLPYTFAAKYLARTDYGYVTVCKNTDILDLKKIDKYKNLPSLKAKLLIINGNNIDNTLINKISHKDLFVASNYAKYNGDNYLVYLNPDKMEDVFYGLAQRFCNYEPRKCEYFTKRCRDYVALIEDVKLNLLNLAKKLKQERVSIIVSNYYYYPLFDFMKIKPYLLSKIENNIDNIKGPKIAIFPSKKMIEKYKSFLDKNNIKAIVFNPNIKGDYAKAFIVFYKKMMEILK